MKNQREVLAYLRTVESATLQQIYNNVSFSYYCSWEANLGKIMSAMVNNGTVTRIKPGLFKLGGKPKMVEAQPNSQQLDLF